MSSRVCLLAWSVGPFTKGGAMRNTTGTVGACGGGVCVCEGGVMVVWVCGCVGVWRWCACDKRVILVWG